MYFETIDFLLLPLYLGLFYLIAFQIRKRNAHDPVYQRNFIRGLNYKMGGALGFSFIYIFYYGNGDAMSFYNAMKPLSKLAFSQPDRYFSFMTSWNELYPPECAYQANRMVVAYILRGTASLTVIRLGSIISILSLNSFIVCNIMFGFVSYLFVWRAFRLFVSLYPKLEKDFVIAFLMVPSVVFWGSGVGKDSIMLGSIMLFFCTYYDLVIRKRKIIRNLFMLMIVVYIISQIRGFLVYTIAPGLLLMTAVYYRNLFKSAVVRFVALPVFIGIGLVGSLVFVERFGNMVESYSMESLQKKAEGFHSWHTTLGETQGGSFYSLGDDVDYSVAGIMRKAPLALAITLFGPFVWQIKNVVMLVSGIESLIFLYYFSTVFINIRVYRAFSVLSKDHIVMFCILFIVAIGIAVGMTSFNYGALVRYKIPILPFFVVLISVTRYRIKYG
ncbi:MAG: hypothetical protein IPP77_08830 [Bacteroidetes bacterium]|nr:hypothetical protein [Bacteroidota bacterium]